ncbi:MAG: hypothetical protein WBN75_15880 [Verrucomicrobiia bacterium]|jgi:hypothetical protein
MIVALAYKYVAMTLMLAEINFCANRLHLSADLPIKEQDIKAMAVFPPRVIGFAGRIDTAKYSFSFAKSGRLRFITSLNDNRGNLSLREYQEQMSRIKSIINTKDAYQIATNWLAAMDVDVQRLEKENPHASRQQFFSAWQDDQKTNADKEVALPFFDVRWGDWVEPVIDVKIFGATGELLKLRQENDSYSMRPASLIKDSDKLLAIPDEEFMKYSPLELSNLVARFAVDLPVSREPTGVSDSTETKDFDQLVRRFGGTKDYQLIESPKNVKAWRTIGFKKNGEGIVVPANVISRLTKILTNGKSYLPPDWRDHCIHKPDLVFNFSDGTRSIDLFFCLDCKAVIPRSESGFKEQSPSPSYSIFEGNVSSEVAEISKTIFAK